MSRGVDNPGFTSFEEVALEEIPRVSAREEQSSARPSDLSTRQHVTEDDEYREGPCGWGRFTPRSLQHCNNPVGYLVFFSLLAVMQSAAVNGLVNVSLSTIEKRFHLNSSMTGLVAASYDISFCAFTLFVSFYGQRGHTPRWLAASSFVIGLGSMIFALPHFFSSLYEYGAEFKDVCPTSANNTVHRCNSSQSSSEPNYLYVFILGQLLMGVGGTPLYTLGTAFFDDSLPTHKASLFIGIGYGMSIVGPAVGYVVGGQLLEMYIDSNRVPSVELTSADPRWLGSWWTGFLICWICLWLLIGPLSCFPKHLPGTAKVQAHTNGGERFVAEKDTGKTFKDFHVSLKVLLKNPVFMCLTISSCADALTTGGFAAFLPKFIENQFSQTSSSSATIGGGLLIPAAALGQVLGGIIISKAKMQCRNVILFSVVVTGVSLILSSVFLFTKCGNHPYAGVSVNYNGTGGIGDLTAPCNVNCSCLRPAYEPTCGRDNVQYFSPCYAGCTSHSIEHGEKLYYNCSCVGKLESAFLDAFNTSEAKSAKCAPLCKNMPIFMCFFFVAVVSTFMSGTPVTMAILRCVPDQQRSFALGVQWLFIRLLGAIPGPLVFGATIDGSCILWNIKPCGEHGACWTYDNDKMSDYLVAISAVCKCISILFLILAFCVYKPSEKKEQPMPDSSKHMDSVST